jgi:hypothetical protein
MEEVTHFLCFADRSYLRITEQKFVSLPIDVSTESSVTVIVIEMCLSLDHRESYFLEWNMSETAHMESLLTFLFIHHVKSLSVYSNDRVFQCSVNCDVRMKAAH